MTKNDSRNIPTLGFSTQKEAVLALHKEGHSPTKIAELASAKISAVHRILSAYRVANGLPAPGKSKPKPNVKPWGQPSAIWDLDEEKRKLAFAKRAAKAAREARFAA